MKAQMVPLRSVMFVAHGSIRSVKEGQRDINRRAEQQTGDGPAVLNSYSSADPPIVGAGEGGLRVWCIRAVQVGM